jgi:hypothetical protein
MLERIQRMSKTNLKLSIFSIWSMVVRDGRIIEDSDEHLPKGMIKSAGLRPPLETRLCPADPRA